MAEGGGGGPQISFKFQVGLTKDRVVVDSTDLTLKSIKTLACDFINEKFPEHGISRLAERLMVFRHDYTATNALQVTGQPTIDFQGKNKKNVLFSAAFECSSGEVAEHIDQNAQCNALPCSKLDHSITLNPLIRPYREYLPAFDSNILDSNIL